MKASELSSLHDIQSATEHYDSCPTCHKAINEKAKKEILSTYSKSLRDNGPVVKCRGCGLNVSAKEDSCPGCGGTAAE